MTTVTDYFPQADAPVAAAAAAVAPAQSPQSLVGSVARVQEAVATAPPALALKHSRFGLVSFALSLVVGGGEFLIFAVATVYAAANSGTLDPTSPAAVGLGLLLCAGIPLALLGAALGTVGLFEQDRKKVFAVLGLILHLAIAVALGLLFIVGNQMPAAATSYAA